MKNKKEIRREYQRKRDLLTNDEIHSLSIEIANQVLKMDLWSNRLFHLFLSMEGKKEVRTEYILQILQGRDKNVAISKSDFETHQLKHYLLTDQTVLKVNIYGIPEPVNNEFEVAPENLDVVFIPLLAVDRIGNRIGYGKGFYDRFLARCRPDVLKIGISFFEPLNYTLLSERFDMPLNQLVTPKGITYFP